MLDAAGHARYAGDGCSSSNAAQVYFSTHGLSADLPPVDFRARNAAPHEPHSRRWGGRGGDRDTRALTSIVGGRIAHIARIT